MSQRGLRFGRFPSLGVRQLGRPARRSVWAVLVLAAALALALAGCSGQPREQVRGHVVDVAVRNFTEVESLRIRDEAGKIWDFKGAEGFIGFTPSHVKEHQLQGLSVLVSYVREGDALVAVHLAD